jgi:hypothetical protein
VGEACCSKLQDVVSASLIRHRSVIDVISKLQDTTARVSRTVAKAATECGCVEYHVSPQQAPEGVEFSKLTEFMKSHVTGELCEDCREALEKEIGRSLFYLVSLCDVMGLKFDDIVSQEFEHVRALGKYTLA